MDGRISKAVRTGLCGFVMMVGLLGAGDVLAQTKPAPTAQIQWGIWMDQDGCQHWWSDGGSEGFMVDRVNPKTGKPVCVKQNNCLTMNTDTMFATDSAQLTGDGRRRLQDFFQNAGAFGYAVYGHTDSRASDEYNISLSQRRAASVAGVAKSLGAVVEREIGFGERQPIASNATAEGMRQNRRVEVICYRW